MKHASPSLCVNSYWTLSVFLCIELGCAMLTVQVTYSNYHFESLDVKGALSHGILSSFDHRQNYR